MKKIIFTLCFIVALTRLLPAQVVFTPEGIDSLAMARLSAQLGQKKQIPAGFRTQILLALSAFPELAQTQIVFRLCHSRVPLSARPSLGSVLRRAAKRKYVISISQKSIPRLEAILLGQLPFEAQVGVLGHELSHIAFYHSKSSWRLLGIALGQFSGKYVDRFEFDTDRICIDHGLGFHLLAWSTHVREALHSPCWPGATNLKQLYLPHERYMNPATIRKILGIHPLYSSNLGR